MNRKFPSILFLCCITAPASALNFDLNDLGKALTTLQQKTQQAATDIDEPKEIELGGGIASNLLGVSPLLQDRYVQRYVNNVGLWLALQTERPDLPWRFGVLDDNDINAFAAPGGYVFVTKGLLTQMKNEAELAGVLAHEIAHVLRKHYLEAIKQGARSGLFAEFAGQVIQKKGADPALNKLVGAGTEVYARGLDKSDEFEADRMGVVIATRAGYDPYGLPAVLQTLQGMGAQDSSLALLFKTHPGLNERLGMLERLMSEQFDGFEQRPDHTSRFMAVMGRTGILVKAGQQ